MNEVYGKYKCDAEEYLILVYNYALQTKPGKTIYAKTLFAYRN